MLASEVAVSPGFLFLTGPLPGARQSLEEMVPARTGFDGKWGGLGLEEQRAPGAPTADTEVSSCQIFPFCHMQPCSMTSRCGVTVLRPPPPPCRAGWVVRRPLPFSRICSRFSCGFFLPPIAWGPGDRQTDF